MRQTYALGLAILISISVTVGELLGGIFFNSVSLLSDSFHALSDVLALSFALVSIQLARRPPVGRLTFGYHRIEVVSALINGIMLFVAVIYILSEAYARFLEPQAMGIQGVLLVGIMGLGANILSVYFAKTSGDFSNLSVRSAFLHILSDVAGSVAVILGALVALTTGLTSIDPLVAVLMSALLARSASKIISEGVGILMERAPQINMDEVRASMTKIEGVLGVHDIHVWRISSQITVGSAHIVVGDITVRESEKLRNSVERMLIRKYKIGHSTLQLETRNRSEAEAQDL